MVSNRKVIKIKANYGNTCSIKITKGVDPQLKGVMCSDNKRYFQILKDNFVKNKQKKIHHKLVEFIHSLLQERLILRPRPKRKWMFLIFVWFEPETF